MNDQHLPLGLLLALLLAGLLAGMLRWTYGTHHQHVAPPAEGTVDEDLGLLREVAVMPSADSADDVRRLLAADGIRATVRPTADNHGRRILVFTEDEPAARSVLSRPD